MARVVAALNNPPAPRSAPSRPPRESRCNKEDRQLLDTIETPP